MDENEQFAALQQQKDEAKERLHTLLANLSPEVKQAAIACVSAMELICKIDQDITALNVRRDRRRYEKKD